MASPAGDPRREPPRAPPEAAGAPPPPPDPAPRAPDPLSPAPSGCAGTALPPAEPAAPAPPSCAERPAPDAAPAAPAPDAAPAVPAPDAAPAVPAPDAAPAAPAPAAPAPDAAPGGAGAEAAADEQLMLAACVAGNAGLVRTLLRHRADVDATSASGLTPLVVAVVNGHVAVVEALLERGAGVCGRSIVPAVALAGKSGHADVVRSAPDAPRAAPLGRGLGGGRWARGWGS